MAGKETYPNGDEGYTYINPRLARPIGAGKHFVDPESEQLLNNVAKAGEAGLTVSQGIDTINLLGGMLGFWGLVTSAEGEGLVTYRLPSEAAAEIENDLKIRNEIERVRDETRNNGFALTSFEALGINGKNFDFAYHLQNYEELLQEYKKDMPKGRKRARGAAIAKKVQKQELPHDALLRDGVFFDTENDSGIAIKETDPRLPGRPDYPVLKVGLDLGLSYYAAMLAELSGLQISKVGLNMFKTGFETEGKVVTEPHRDLLVDNDSLLAIAVVRVDGLGAESVIYKNENYGNGDRNDKGRAGKLLFRGRLGPGDIAVVNDLMCLHGSTLIEPYYPGHKQSRITLTSTVDRIEPNLLAA